MYDRLRRAEDILLCEVESQMDDLACVDTKELGEVIDMIKDIEEATYYCTVTHSMRKSHPHEDAEESEEEMEVHDHREGRSHLSRKAYMEAKEWHKDKAQLLKELEKYMIDVSQDIMEIVEDASMEEKQYLEKKVNSLVSKIGQMK